MMTKRTKFLFLASTLLFTFLFTNFIRFTSLEEYPPMSTDALTAYLHGDGQKEWRATSFALLGIINTQKCRLDDKIILKNDGTFEYDGGKNLCGREDNERLRKGKWHVSESGKKLVFEYEKGRKRKKSERHEGEVVNAGGGWIVLSGTYKGISLKGTYFAQ